MMDNDKKELLVKVWNTCTFDEIIDAGFELNKCGASDILGASKDFENFDYLMYVIENVGLGEILDNLKDEHSLREIIDEFDVDDVMDCLSDDDMLDHIDGSWALNGHDDEIRSESYNEGYDDGLKDGENNNLTELAWLNMLRNSDANKLVRFFCDMFGVSYYDNESLYNKFNEMFSDLDKSFYKKDDKKWELTRK